MGILSSNKELSAARIDCGGSFQVKLSLTAAPDILTNPTDIVLVLDRSGSMEGSALFNLKVGAVHNRGWDDGQIEWVLAHTDKDLKVKEIVTDIHTVTLGDDVKYSSVKGICNEDIVFKSKFSTI